MNKMGLFAVLLGLSLLLSGCADIAVSPEEKVRTALETFPDEMGPNGSVKKLEGTFSSDQTSLTADVEIEVGDNGVYVFTISAGIFSFKVYCTESSSLTQFGQRTLEARSRHEVCPGEADEPGESVLEGEIEVQSTQTLEDGTIEADVVATSAEGDRSVIDVVLNADGKIASMSIENATGTFEFEIDYGPRRTINMPDPTARMPADVSYRDEFSDGTYTWTATNHNDTVPLEEFEIRVTEANESGEDVVLATFDPDNPDIQEEAGFTFRFEDDGDGALTSGDSFTVSKDDWEYIWEYDVVVWDTWAEVGIDELVLPGPGPVILLIGIGAVALVRRWMGRSP